MSRIGASVGLGGTNRPDDVRTIQRLLNQFSMPPLRALDVDGYCGQHTIDTIKHFQSSKVGMAKPDGRVDPGGRTLRMLLDGPGAGKEPAPAGNGASEGDTETPRTARADRRRRNEFVGGSVKEKENTTRIIDGIEPHFRGVRARVISGFLNDADLFWKVNYHWELLLWMVEHSLTLNITPQHRKTLESIRSSLGTVKPEPQTGYRESPTVGRPADRSTLEQFDERYKVLRSAKKEFKSVMTAANLPSLSKREEKAFDLAAAPVAHPGTSKHATGYALDIEGDNSRISSLSHQLGATLVFDEKSHVHVEWKNGVRAE